MKILWLCNMILPNIALKLQKKSSNFGGWMVGLADQILEEDNMLREDSNKEPKYEYYVSDIPEKFAAIAEEFLKKEIDDIKNVRI